jgi:Domain of unknown function (DUF4304)
MSEISKRIDQIIGLELAPYLKSLGFRKAGRNFHRKDKQSIAVINIQASSWNEGGRGQFTLNIGRYFPAVAELEGARIGNEVPKEYECTIRERIGGLTPEKNDYWWEITPQVDNIAIANAVLQFVASYAIPWLARIESPTELLQELRMGFPSITAASVAILLGDMDEATSIANALLGRRPMANAHVNVWAKRNGVQLV